MESNAQSKALLSTRLAAATMCSVLPFLAFATTVTNCEDSGPGSLRQAIADTPDGGTIDATGLATVCSAITVKTGALSVGYDDLTINGPGADKLFVTALLITSRTFHHYQSAIFNHTGRGTLTLNNLSVTSGLVTTTANQQMTGGCIKSTANVSLINSNVSDCKVASPAQASCGAIDARGAVYLKGSQVTGNAADGTAYGGVGGGICAGSIKMRQSTIAGNTISGGTGESSVVSGGGFSANSADVAYSTISGNSATGGKLSHYGFPTSEAGGFYALGAVTVANSTVSGNYAAYFAGARVNGSDVTLVNSTIAFNHGSDYNAGAAFISATNGFTLDSNIFSNNTWGASSIPFDLTVGGQVSPTGTHNLVFASHSALPADTIRNQCALLAPLSNNGGPTLTHQLWSHSPAINAGNNLQGFSYDQRGPHYLRVSGGNADIGSYEVDAADEVFGSGFDGC